MSNVNSATVSGNLTRDPETRWTSDDGKSAIVNFGIAVNRRRYDKTAEEYVDEVSFFDIEVFGGFAVLVQKKLRKADAATVQGRLEQNSWETDDGRKHSKVVIVAEQIDSEGFFRSKDEDGVGSGDTPAATETPAETPVAVAAGVSAADIPF